MRAPIRFGPWVAPLLAAMVVGASATPATAATPRFSAQANVSVAPSAHTTAIGVERYRLSARMAPTITKATHAGAGFDLSGVLAAAPLGCSNDDTIFRNGFDP
ncbi:MAG: hypothetical protein U1F23_05760 [Lysobacterales bacterium]